MDNNFQNLNLSKFAHSYNVFFDATVAVLNDAYKNDTLLHILPEKIYMQFRYSEYGRNHLGLMSFLTNSYISREDKEGFISLLNEIIIVVKNLFKLRDYELDSKNRNLKLTLVIFSDLIQNTNDTDVFDLDFYFDNKDWQFKRKLDAVTTETINKNTTNFIDGDTNKSRYEDSVAEFLSFKNDDKSNKKLFYNQSLDKLKRIVENTLENEYKRKDGNFPKISDRKQISKIIFGDRHGEFENRIGYVVSNIHHEKGGKPKEFTEKEYVYLWLELNQILYLLNRYKK